MHEAMQQLAHLAASELFLQHNNRREESALAAAAAT